MGIDSGGVLTTSVGIEDEDSRDLVWAGKIANIASKHTDLEEFGEIFVTKRFYSKLPVASKTNGGNDIWKQHYLIKENDSVPVTCRINRVQLIDRDELIDMITDYKGGTISVFNRLLAPFKLRLDRN